MNRDRRKYEFEGAAISDGRLIDRPIADTVNLLPIHSTSKGLRLREGSSPYVKIEDETPPVADGLLVWQFPNVFRTGAKFVVLQNASDGKLVDVVEYFEQVGRIAPSDPSEGGDLDITAPVLFAEALGFFEIGLVWVETSGLATSFKLYRSTDPEAAMPWTLVGTFDAETVEYTDTGLDADTTYYYYLETLLGELASDESNIADATTFAGEMYPPYNLLIEADGYTSVVLTWELPVAEDFPGLPFLEPAAVVVERYNPDTDEMEEIARLAADAVTYTDEDLEPGASYFYRVGVDSEA